MSLEEKITELEDEIRRTSYNKATMHHIGRLKARIARLKDNARAKASKKGPKHGYSVKKTGDATVVMVGFPSVGKSTLLNKLTNAKSTIGAYHFTTLTVVPGMMIYNHAKIQLLDIPGLIKGAAVGKGSGKQVLSVIRNSDLILIIADPKEPQQVEILKNELYEGGFRLNAVPPDVIIKKKDKGGVNFLSTVSLPELDEEMAREVLNEYSIHNADVLVREKIGLSEFIDAVNGNRHYVPMVVVFNKIDTVSEAKLKKAVETIDCDVLCVSASSEKNLDKLRESIFRHVGLIRVFLKKIGEEPDLSEPLIIKKGTRIMGVCRTIHKRFAADFKFARVWGSSKFDGQRVSKGYAVSDKDIVELHF
ncbi:MAG: GTP-binding protein [Candidatus Diapherotrites archaeon]|nr:GTP-binding protein [Candidatus Diapherotrites archaeon]